jgi:hypothetical protein
MLRTEETVLEDPVSGAAAECVVVLGCHNQPVLSFKKAGVAEFLLKLSPSPLVTLVTPDVGVSLQPGQSFP